MRTRLGYAFIHTYKPVLDGAPYRSFERTAADNVMVVGLRPEAAARPRAAWALTIGSPLRART